jgi:hypothetical protein
MSRLTKLERLAELAVDQALEAYDLKWSSERRAHVTIAAAEATNAFELARMNAVTMSAGPGFLLGDPPPGPPPSEPT